jgi:hypothetical protein
LRLQSSLDPASVLALAGLTTPVPEALELQRPLPDDMLQIVAQGEKKDGLAA